MGRRARLALVAFASSLSSLWLSSALNGCSHSAAEQQETRVQRQEWVKRTGIAPGSVSCDPLDQFPEPRLCSAVLNGAAVMFVCSSEGCSWWRSR